MRESVAPSRVQVPNEMSVLEHKPYWWLPVTKAIVPVLLLCAVGLLPKSVAKSPGEVDIGDTVGEATLQGLNGPPRQLSEFRGRPLIINLWVRIPGDCDR